MSELATSIPATAAEAAKTTPAPPAATPNQELATRVTGALMAAGLLPPSYQEQCETLLAEGKATDATWTKFLEKPADSSTPSSSTSHA